MALPAANVVRGSDSPPLVIERSCPKLAERRSEGCLRCCGISPRAGAADAASVPDVSRLRVAIVAAGATDMMRSIRAEPDLVQRHCAQFGEPPPERSLCNPRISSRTRNANPVALPGKIRARVTVVPGRTADAVRVIRATIFPVQRCSAQFGKLSAESCLTYRRVHARANKAEPLAAPHALRSRTTSVTRRAPDSMRHFIAEPAGLKKRRAQLVQALAELRLRRNRGGCGLLVLAANAACSVVHVSLFAQVGHARGWNYGALTPPSAGTLHRKV